MKNFYEQFKTPIVTVALIFIAFAVYTKIFGPIPFYINSVNTTKTDLFSSSGIGEVTEVPNEATINVGVTKTATTVEDAQKQTNTVANKLISDLKKMGIGQKNIKTTNYSVNPSYTGGEIMMMPGRGNQNGYEVTQNIEVKINPIENVNKIVDLATQDGANLVGGINFTFSDELQKSLDKKATQMAVDDAKEKAQTMADSAGVRLGKIVNIVSSSSNPRPFMMGAAQKTADETTTNVTPGQNTVSIGVTIYYETY
jgi:uncharacterized protein